MGITKMSSMEKEQNKRKRKEAKRRDANAIERRRIKEFNEALRRLREVTKHISIDNKKKGRKVTKLTTIKAAIKHIKNLEHALDMDVNRKNSTNNFIFEDETRQRQDLNENEKETRNFELEDEDLTWNDSCDRSPLASLVPSLPTLELVSETS